MKKYILYTIAAAWVSLPLAVHAEALLLAKDGKPNATIIVHEHATAAEKYAAAELKRFLKLITTADFSGTSAPVSIYVGPDAAKAADPTIAELPLSNDGIVIRTKANQLILTGGRPRGTLYAVFTFLEDVAGCRFWSGRQKKFPAETFIPSRKTFAVPPLNIVYKPVFEFREPYWGYNLDDPDWCVRNKVVGRITKTGEPESKFGGHFRSIGHIQSFWYWVNPKDYFKEHPEYFSEIDGKRMWRKTSGVVWADRQTQLCMSNPDVAELIAQKMIRYIRSRKGKVEMVSLAPNDWNNPCQCSACRAIYKKEGSPAGALLLLLNRIAEKLESHYPDVLLVSGAYMWYQKPPLTIAPRKNVNIWFVTQGFNQCELYHAPVNAERFSHLQKWAELCKKSGSKLYVWDHSANFAHYLVPLPNLHTWQFSIRNYAQIGVKGVWFLGPYSKPNMELSAIRNYVMAKLLWNPNLDVDQLLHTCIQEYYGKAGNDVQKYIDIYHDAHRKSGQILLGWNWSPLQDCRFLSPETIEKCYQAILDAEKSAGNDPQITQRVLRLKLGLWYLYLIRYDELKLYAKQNNHKWFFPEGIQELYHKFNRSLADAQIMSFAEEGRSWWPFIKERVQMGEDLTPPPGCENMAPESWTIVPLRGFKNNKASQEFEFSKQPDQQEIATWRPKSGKQTLLHPLWIIPINHLATNQKQKIRLFISVKYKRAKNTDKEIAFRCGVQHSSNRTIKLSEISENHDTTIDLGLIHSPADWRHLFLELPAQGDTGVEKICIKTIWLVKEK